MKFKEELMEYVDLVCVKFEIKLSITSHSHLKINKLFSGIVRVEIFL